MLHNMSPLTLLWLFVRLCITFIGSSSNVRLVANVATCVQELVPKAEAVANAGSGSG